MPRMSQAQLKAWTADRFILRHFLRSGAGFVFSSENGRQGPQILVSDDFSEMLLGQKPSRGGPSFHRSTMSASRQRVTLPVRFCTPLCGLSMTLVVPRHLYSDGGSFSLWIVNISSRPSRRLRAADS